MPGECPWKFTRGGVGGGGVGGFGAKKKTIPPLHASAIVKKNLFRPSDYIAFAYRIYVGNPWLRIAHYWHLVCFLHPVLKSMGRFVGCGVYDLSAT